MEKDIDPVIIKATQSSLGKYVKRPPLTEKLLKKPPFRFLHDIVTSVLKTTGFFNGLFEEEELVSDNVKDRENKIAFLNKVITVVGLTTGKALSVKPSKIVAGQEPDKTNELLQCLAHALDKKLSSDDAVKQFREGAIKGPKHEEKKSKDLLKPTKKTSEPNNLTSKSNEKLTNNKKESRTSNKPDSEKSNVNKTKKEKNSLKIESPPKKSIQNLKPPSTKKNIENKRTDKLQDSQNENVDKKIVELDMMNNENGSLIDPGDQPRVEIVESVKNVESFLPEENKHFVPMNSSVPIENEFNSSLSSQDLMEAENVKTDDPKANLDNPNKVESIPVIKHTDSTINNCTSPKKTLARKSDLINREENINTDPPIIQPSEVKPIARPLSVRPSSSRPGAPRPRDKHDNFIIEAENVLVGKVNIIAESSPNEEEEDSIIVIVDQESNNTKSTQPEHEQLHASQNEHGHLVQQILDSQKEYSQMSGKTEIEWQFGAQKARDELNKEIEQLRFDIQALSRVAHPLGKVMDHIQEDVEVMRQELIQWTNTYEETSKELFKQKAANEDSLFPLYAKVKQLGIDIDEKHDKINDLKIMIHKNSLRIDKLLSNGTVQ